MATIRGSLTTNNDSRDELKVMMADTSESQKVDPQNMSEAPTMDIAEVYKVNNMATATPNNQLELFYVVTTLCTMLILMLMLMTSTMILIKLDASAQCAPPPVVSGDHSLHQPGAGQVAPSQGDVHSDFVVKWLVKDPLVGKLSHG